MTQITTRFARRHADRADSANGSTSFRKIIRNTAFTAGALLALVLAAITALWTWPYRTPHDGSDSPQANAGIEPRDESPGSPWSTGETAAASQLPRFRFPNERYRPAARDSDWHILGANHSRGENGSPTILGSSKHRVLHFTFDDGPSIENTSRVMDTLSDYNIRATFFVLGSRLYGSDSNAHRELLRELDKSGHTVALHSYTHNDLRSLSDSRIHRELRRSEHMLQATLGYRPGLFRPPYGGRSERTSDLLRTRGYTEILWNIAPEEYGARTPWEIASQFHAALVQQEQNGYGPGGIVLLHDRRGGTADALRLIMEELRVRNCALLDQDGEELWDVVGDLSYFLFHGETLPDSLVEKRQVLAREAAAGYCAGAGKKQQQTPAVRASGPHPG